MNDNKGLAEAIDVMRRVASVLDYLLGDTDPDWPDDYTDEDIKRELPVFWCCRELNRAISAYAAQAVAARGEGVGEPPTCPICDTVWNEHRCGGCGYEAGAGA